VAERPHLDAGDLKRADAEKRDLGERVTGGLLHDLQGQRSLDLIPEDFIKLPAPLAEAAIKELEARLA
jgi:hypothetical protein